jgi:hypothetical protein
MVGPHSGFTKGQWFLEAFKVNAIHLSAEKGLYLNNYQREDPTMPRGGKREGAGRKRGSTNRFSQRLMEFAQESGEMPLDYLLRVMRDDTERSNIRIDAAKAAAPYVHHRLCASAVSLSTDMSHEEWLRSLS